MSASQDSLAVEYERHVSSLSSPRVLIDRRESTNWVLIRGDVQGLNIIPPTQSNEGEREDREADLNSGEILIQIDGQPSQSPISGEQQGPTLQQNAIGIPETPPLESTLLVTVQVLVTLLTAWPGNDKNHLSFSAKFLRDFAVGSTIVGYISSFSSILMCRLSTSRASRILNTVAYAGAAFGFIASMSMLLPDELRLWVTFLSCAACLPALAAGFCN